MNVIEFAGMIVGTILLCIAMYIVGLLDNLIIGG